MKKKKLNLKELKLKSIVQELSKDQQKKTKGGLLKRRGGDVAQSQELRFTEVSTRDGLTDEMDFFSRYRP